MAFERARTWMAQVIAPGRRAIGGVRGLRSLFEGGRLSADTQFLSLTPGLQLLGGLSADDQWRNAALDQHTLTKVSPRKLIELLADVSPDVSRALWDFILFMNPGWECHAYKLGSDKVEDPVAQQMIDDFLRSLHGPFTADKQMPPDVIFGMLFIGLFMRGALFAELVLNEAGDTPLEIATPDPYTVVAQSVQDPVRGLTWTIGQFQLGKFVVLNRPTIFYIPLHPLPNRPYGRPLAAPAVFSTLFLIGLLHDLRRVIAQQGYPRLDIALDSEKLMGIMPQELAEDPDAFDKWVAKAVQQVKATYAALQPDDAFIHADTMKLNRPVGTMDAGSLGGLDGLIKAVERQAVRALKSMPLLFGINEATSETHANRQWEVHVAGIKSLQHMTETMLEGMLTIALQVQGVAADIEFRFAELRAAELLRDAQVEAIQTNNALAQFQAGWISQDEASIRIVGHKADSQEPRPLPLPPANLSQDTGGDSSGHNAMDIIARLSDLLPKLRKPKGLARCLNCESMYIDDIPGIGTIDCPRCGAPFRRGSKENGDHDVLVN